MAILDVEGCEGADFQHFLLNKMKKMKFYYMKPQIAHSFDQNTLEL